MCLLPAAVVFVGCLAVMTADEFRTGKDATEGHVKVAFLATILFAVLGIIFR